MTNCKMRRLLAAVLLSRLMPYLHRMEYFGMAFFLLTIILDFMVNQKKRIYKNAHAVSYRLIDS